MDLESLQDRKYKELIKLAKKLNLELPQSKKKDILIKAIKEYYQSHDVNQSDVELLEKNDKKEKKSSKKSKSVHHEETEQDIDPNNQTMTRSRAQALINQTLNKTEHSNEADDEQLVETKKTKKTKKSNKKESKENVDHEVIETRYEIREDGKKVKIKRVKKKVKKEASSVDQEKKIKKKTKNTNEDDKENVTLNESIDHEKEISLNDEKNDFKLELNESVEDDKSNHLNYRVENPVEVCPKIEKEENNKADDKIESANHADNLELANSSLITNDEEKVDNENNCEDPNLTKDLLNTTFEKKDELVSCTSFYSKKLDLPVVDTPECVEETNNCHSEDKPIENKHIEMESKVDEEAKPRTGGARIVRPKQTVTVLQTIKTNKNETRVEEVKQVVDVVNREAGPRIVKPMIIVQDICADPKRKNFNDPNNKLKKIKENEIKKKDVDAIKVVAKKVPDFKAIHEKESQKMESIDTYANRKQERQNKLNEKTTPNVTEDKLKVKTRTPNLKINSQNVISKKTPLKTATTPKFVKNLASQTSSLLSNIPRIIKREENKKDESNKPETKTTEPKTPEMANQEKISKLARTPSSVSRPTESSLLKSNIKRAPSVKAGPNDANSLSSLTPQLQSSSFVRRKSFDLNRSLARPLNYNPHHGKLKKVDFSTKSIFLASLATNLNESKCADKTVLKSNDSILNASDASKRRVSTINKLRSDNVGSCTDRNMVADYLKSDKLKQITDKSTQMAKKMRLEKAKIHKQTKSDQNRKINLENCENEQEV